MRESGLTLIELIIAMALVGVLAAVAVPALQEAKGSRHADRLAHEISRDLEQLHLFASMTTQPLTLRISRSTLTAEIDATERVILTRLLDHAQFELAGDEQLAHFYDSGVITPLTLAITAGGRRCEITMALRGRVRSECAPS